MDPRKALTCALLSQEVYQAFSPQLKFSGFADITPDLVEQASTDTQFAILSDAAGTALYIVFRGSEKRLDWETNFSFKQSAVEFQQKVIENQIVQEQEQVYPYTGESSSGAQMHQGFATAYLSVREKIHQYLRNRPAASVTVTGHSLGGALATLCAVDIQYNFSPQVQRIDLYSFGSPRVGNNGFRESFNRRVPSSYRLVYGMDMVPALPRPWQGYRHVDTEYRFGPRLSFNIVSQRLKDHAIANYVAALKDLVAKQSR
jgi:triacylglycerol lipase